MPNWDPHSPFAISTYKNPPCVAPLLLVAGLEEGRFTDSATRTFLQSAQFIATQWRVRSDPWRMRSTSQGLSHKTLPQAPDELEYGLGVYYLQTSYGLAFWLFRLVHYPLLTPVPYIYCSADVTPRIGQLAQAQPGHGLPLYTQSKLNQGWDDFQESVLRSRVQRRSGVSLYLWGSRYQGL